jgi:hypothetical protein
VVGQVGAESSWRPDSSTSWPPHHPTDRGKGPFQTLSSKTCDTPLSCHLDLSPRRGPRIDETHPPPAGHQNATGTTAPGVPGRCRRRHFCRPRCLQHLPSRAGPTLARLTSRPGHAGGERADRARGFRERDLHLPGRHDDVLPARRQVLRAHGRARRAALQLRSGLHVRRDTAPAISQGLYGQAILP